MSSAKERMLAHIQKIREREAKIQEEKSTKGQQLQHATKNVPIAKPIEVKEKPLEGEIILNEKQKLAPLFAQERKEFCLIGAAGTGKTTALKQTILSAAQLYGVDLSVGAVREKTISVVCYTRRAVRAASRALKSINAESLCMTAHTFLEYQPERYEYHDDEGNIKKTMRFVPGRTKYNPLNNVKLIIIDEASMLDYYKLFKELREAAPNAIFIYVGDLNQIPPVFGHAVLGFKLATCPVIQLTEVYRQAMDSPIVAFQHNFTLAHQLPSDSELKKISATATDNEGLEFIPFKKDDQDGTVMAEAVAHYIIRQLDSGLYDPEQDIILIPFNVNFGSIAINYQIAQTLGDRRNAVIWEVIAGREKKYFAEGDLVMHQKKDCVITCIESNPKYMGQIAQKPSKFMTRSGLIKNHDGEVDVDIHNTQTSALESMTTEELLSMDDDDTSEVKRAASATITVKDVETGWEEKISTCGEVMSLDFRYAMTIHKSQGSEWRKVWVVAHKSHGVMYNRELLYTGMTRASSKCTVLYSPQTRVGKKDNSIAKAISKGAIPGKTLEQKIEFFIKLAQESKHQDHEDY